MRRTFVLTKAGSEARASRRSGLPPHYRQILGLIRSVIAAEQIYLALRSHSRQEVDGWLDELDTLGFISRMPSAAGSEHGPVERWRLALR